MSEQLLFEGEWRDVRDALDALANGTVIRWESYSGLTIAIKRHGRWYEAGFSVLRLSESIARDETPIEVIA